MHLLVNGFEHTVRYTEGSIFSEYSFPGDKYLWDKYVIYLYVTA
jgi:hypothetical protein